MNRFNKKSSILVLMIVLILFAIYIEPLNGFRHGHYYEEYDFTQITDEDWYSQISLENQSYEMKFSPTKEYLNGVSIFLQNQPENNEGMLLLTVSDEYGEIIDEIEVDLSQVKSSEWYKIQLNTELKKGKVYILKFSTKGCKYCPYLQTVNRDYLPDETVSGNILIAYSYALSTFTFQERILIVALVFSIELMLTSLLIGDKRAKLKKCSMFLFFALLLSWNYMHNSLDDANEMYTDFQKDSDALVTSVIDAEIDGNWYRNQDEFGFGLGNYANLRGQYIYSDRGYITNDDWDEGYSRTEPALKFNYYKYNDYLEEIAVIGYIVRFSNEEEYSITEVQVEGQYITLYLDCDSILSPLKYGSLDDVIFYDSNNNELPKGLLKAYKSQYGLQGKIFRHLARYMKEDDIVNNLYLICCTAASTVFLLITLLIASNYNKILAGCFFVTFAISPWIVCFARSIYWVEFIWFVPMLIGLFCQWKIDNKRCRILSYFAVFMAIFIKSLCGYEYISAIMMSSISFLLVEMLVAFIQKDNKKGELLIRTIIMFGIMELLGFIAAMLMHAMLRGEGNVIFGVQQIFNEDVLRRTSGGDLNTFSTLTGASINASVWEVFSKYFKFGTQVMPGIDGNLFPLLCIVPICLFVMDYKDKRLNIKYPLLYSMFFLTSISWICLAKGHSYIHTHMNYVLWYFGFVQICLYVIVERLIELANKHVSGD